MNYDEDYDESEMERLRAIEDKYNAINAKINVKIGHPDLHDDLDDHNSRVEALEYAINHPIQNAMGRTALGTVLGTLGGAAVAPAFKSLIPVGIGAVAGGALGLSSRISRMQALSQIDEARATRDAFQAEFDKLGA
jgi:hypothetical protein